MNKDKEFMFIFRSLDVLRELMEELEKLLEQKNCKICGDRPACCVFPPCQHKAICSMCYTDTCPECGEKIQAGQRVVVLHANEW